MEWEKMENEWTYSWGWVGYAVPQSKILKWMPLMFNTRRYIGLPFSTNNKQENLSTISIMLDASSSPSGIYWNGLRCTISYNTTETNIISIIRNEHIRINRNFHQHQQRKQSTVITMKSHHQIIRSNCKHRKNAAVENRPCACKETGMQ